MKSFRNRSRRPASERRFWHRHLVVLLIISSLTAGSLAFLAYSNWSQRESARIAHTKQQEEAAQIDQRVKATIQKKINDAKKAEAAAKAKAEAEALAQAPTVPVATTNQTNIQQCDVKDPASITVVINKKHCFNPKNWVPGNLASYNGFLLQNEASVKLAAMVQAATDAGAGFSLSSAYRSYENQVVTYNTWVRVNGSVAAADTVSARPGFSEHQTGLAADFKVGSCVLECFGGTASYAWLQQNAPNYGFIERYPAGLTAITGYAPESWHWRYIGEAAAQDMKAKNIQTLESYLTVTGGDYR